MTATEVRATDDVTKSYIIFVTAYTRGSDSFSAAQTNVVSVSLAKGAEHPGLELLQPVFALGALGWLERGGRLE